MDRLIDYTRERTLSELAKLPKGEFTATGVVDNDGFTDEPVRLQVRVAIDDEGVLFDLTGCDPQRRAPVNSTYSQTFAACAYVLKCLIDQDVPVKRRVLRTSAARSSRGNSHQLYGTLASSWGLGDPSAALRHHSQGPASGAARYDPGRDQRERCVKSASAAPTRARGQLYSYYETMAGGYGGRSTKDGPDAVQLPRSKTPRTRRLRKSKSTIRCGLTAMN